jgi:hypothetical protein
MAVGRVELAQIARHTVFELRPPALHLGTCEVPVAIVHRLELAAVDRHARRGQQAHLTAQIDEARANLADGAAIVLAKVGNRLVIGNEAAREPHHFDIAARLALEPAARLDPIEIAVDVERQQHRRMIGGPPGRLGIDPARVPRFAASSMSKARTTHRLRPLSPDDRPSHRARQLTVADRKTWRLPSARPSATDLLG